MALSEERKKEILMQSFNVLTQDIYGHSSNIHDLILKMAALDTDAAFEMWRYVLEKYKEIGEKGNETYDLTSSLLDCMVKSLGIERVLSFVVNDPMVRNKIYHESAMPDDKLIAYYIDGSHLHKANELLELVQTNINFLRGRDGDEDRLGRFLYRLFHWNCKNITEDKMEFILSWVDKVPTKEARAKLQVLLIDYM